MTRPRHFLSLLDMTPQQLRRLLQRAGELKAMHRKGEVYAPLTHKVLGMIFEKASTRTRVSFEAGMIQLGGGAIFLSPKDTQLGRGEPVEDSARVLSRMVDIIMVRTASHTKLERFAAYSRVPVINALTDYNHPCQLLADMLTYLEHRGEIAGRRVAWVGDGNNMCNSYMAAALQFGFELRIATPEGYEPDPQLRARCGEQVRLLNDPAQAVEGADLVATDVWASMGFEDERYERARMFAPYQVSSELMERARPDAVFLHCLPAHRGEEVAPEVIDGPRSLVWEEAENRMHTQKALIEWLLLDAGEDAG